MHHPVVVALFSHQLFVCADLSNFAGIDHSYDVSVLDGGHAMSNDYRSTICESVQGGGSEGVRGKEGERKRRNEGGRKRERERGGEEGRGRDRWIESHLHYYQPELTFLSLVEGSLHYRLVSIIQS